MQRILLSTVLAVAMVATLILPVTSLAAEDNIRKQFETEHCVFYSSNTDAVALNQISELLEDAHVRITAILGDEPAEKADIQLRRHAYAAESRSTKNGLDIFVNNAAQPDAYTSNSLPDIREAYIEWFLHTVCEGSGVLQKQALTYGFVNYVAERCQWWIQDRQVVRQDILNDTVINVYDACDMNRSAYCVLYIDFIIDSFGITAFKQHASDTELKDLTGLPNEDLETRWQAFIRKRIPLEEIPKLQKETAHFTFWCADADAYMTDSIAEVLEGSYAYVTGWFQKEPSQKTKVSFSPGYGGSAGEAELDAGYDPVDGLANGNDKVFVHEFAHVVMGGNFGKVFKEGVAAYVSGQDSASLDIPKDVVAGTLRTLPELWSVDQWTWDQWVYSYGYAYVKFLEETYGHSKVLEIIANGGDALKTLELTEEALNSNWISFLNRTYGSGESAPTVKPTATPKPTAAARPTTTAKPTATLQPTKTTAPAPTAKPTASALQTATAPERLKLQKETQHFVVWSSDMDASAAATIADTLERNYARVTSDLRIEPKQETRIEISRGSLGGHAYPDKVVLTYDPAQGVNEYAKQIAVHEFAHMVANAHDPDGGQSAYLSRALYEGVAAYEAGQDSAADDIPKDLASSIYRTLPEIEKLSASDESSIIYSYGYAYTKFLVDTYGYDVLVKILQGQPRTEALGANDSTVNSQWLAFLDRTYGNAANTTMPIASATVRPSSQTTAVPSAAVSATPSASTIPSARPSAGILPTHTAPSDSSFDPSARPAASIPTILGHQADTVNNRNYYAKTSGYSTMYYLRSSSGRMARVSAPYVTSADEKNYYPVNHGGTVLFPRLENGNVTCFCEFKDGMKVPVLTLRADASPQVDSNGYQIGVINEKTYYVRTSGASTLFYLKSSSGRMARVSAPYVSGTDSQRYYPVNCGGVILFPRLKDGTFTSYVTGGGDDALQVI